MNDLTGLGKPLTKLIAVVSKGIGKVYEDTFGIRAEAARIKILSKAQAEADVQKAEILDTVNERISRRIEYVEERKQRNVESVLSLAYNGLPEVVSDVPVDEDWIARFFDIAENISNDKMQVIWGKILTGEIETPGKFSFRTLDVIRNISAKEAELFQILCSITMGDQFVIKPESEEDFSKYGLRHFDLMILAEAGLLSDPGLVISRPTYYDGFPISVRNMKCFLTHPNKKNLEELLLTLSTAGKELSQILNVECNPIYFEDLKTHFKNKGYLISYLDPST